MLLRELNWVLRRTRSARATTLRCAWLDPLPEFHSLQFAVHILQIDFIGPKIWSDPLIQFVKIGMMRVREHPEQIVIPSRSPAVFRWGAPFSRNAGGVMASRPGREDLLHGGPVEKIFAP